MPRAEHLGCLRHIALVIPVSGAALECADVSLLRTWSSLHARGCQSCFSRGGRPKRAIAHRNISIWTDGSYPTSEHVLLPSYSLGGPFLTENLLRLGRCPVLEEEARLRLLSLAFATLSWLFFAEGAGSVQVLSGLRSFVSTQELSEQCHIASARLHLFNLQESLGPLVKAEASSISTTCPILLS